MLNIRTLTAITIILGLFISQPIEKTTTQSQVNEPIKNMNCEPFPECEIERVAAQEDEEKRSQ